MLSAQKVLLQLSLRYLSDDQFWFTFFHEAGHALLHAKSAMFVDGLDEQRSPEEREADQFAERALIPDAYRNEFESLRGDSAQVLRFAQRVGIAPGLVVGQMQHRGKLPPTWLNGLKRRYKWQS
jgi:Zn-dependent peptidase ImmA (M78 family)